MDKTMNQNSATLLDYYGGDMRICLSAWQSTNIELGIDLSPDVKQRIKQLYDATVVKKKKTPEELLLMLAEEGHTSPFRKALVDFQVTADIATHIQCLKHRVGTKVGLDDDIDNEINSESARYKRLVDKWLIPEDWGDIEISDYVHMDGEIVAEPGERLSSVLRNFSECGHKLYHQALEELTPILGRPRAKESARFFLPYAKQLDFDMQMSFEAFVHFVKLRNSPHAQVEIRQIAQSMLEQVRAIPGNPFQYSLKAFGMDVDKEEGYGND